MVIKKLYHKDVIHDSEIGPREGRFKTRGKAIISRTEELKYVRNRKGVTVQVLNNLKCLAYH